MPSRPWSKVDEIPTQNIEPRHPVFGRDPRGRCRVDGHDWGIPRVLLDNSACDFARLWIRCVSPQIFRADDGALLDKKVFESSRVDQVGIQPSPADPYQRDE